LEDLLAKTRATFASEQSFRCARRHILSGLAGFGRHTISGLLRTQNRHQQDWTADYRLYSRDRFDEDAVFDVVRRKVEATLAPDSPLVVAMDDSLLRKTGRKIHGVRYQRDPMSPPFHVNFVRGLRVLQLSAAVPQEGGAARLVPVDFTHAVLPPKPPRTASEEERQAYAKLRAARNINVVGRERLQHLRQEMDRSGSASRPLLVSVDGRFTNGTVLRAVPERTVLIGRLRKDAVLHHLPEGQRERGRRRKYGAAAPTPEQLLKDETVPWQTVRAYACGKVHEFKLKRLGPLVARVDKATQPLQIVVIKALGYRLTKGAKLCYRQPAFLLCTDPDLALEQLLQVFLWRWDIEVNFRDEKTILKVGEAQVRTEASNQNAPALAVAAYALLLLASIEAYGKNGAPDRLHQAKWYQREAGQRATTNELINQLRVELWSAALDPRHFRDFMSASPSTQNSEKSETSLAAALFLSTS
jgi:hypothetical protein